MKQLMAILSVAFLVGFASPVTAGPKMTVRVGVFPKPPFTDIDAKGRVTGFLTDVLATIALQEGWQVEYYPDTWGGSLRSLENGEIDLLAGAAFSAEGSRKFNYSYESVLTEWGQIFVGRDAGIESILDLDGKKVAVLHDDPHFLNLRDLVQQSGIRCRFIEAFDYEDVMMLTERGICSASLVSQFYGFQHSKDFLVNKSTIILSPQKLFFMGQRQENNFLLAVLDSRLRSLKNDNASIYYQAFARWFGAVEPGFFRKWIKWFGLGAFGVLFLFLGIGMLLRAQIRAKTLELHRKNEDLRGEINHHHKTQAALRESEEKYRLLVENANDAIFIVQNDALIFSNHQTETITGYAADELKGMPLKQLIHPGESDSVLNRLRKRLTQASNVDNLTFRIVNKAGDHLWGQLSAVFIHWENQPAVLVFLKDITQHKRLEEQFQAAQRMEGIGTLAGGIAHDFNNLLMGIQGYVSLTLMKLPKDDPVYDKIKNIEQYVQTGGNLTRQLLGFARGGKYEVLPTDMNCIIEKQNQLFGGTRKEVKIHSDFQEKLWPVDVDVSQMEQTLLNLYINAWQAMPGGGDIYLKTENIVIDEYYSKPFQIESGRYIKISITDTGIGMDEPTIKNVFDPFFTTKQKGRGTGLGLASVYGIVKNHGGFINVYSEKGHGATFNIYLPASDQDAVTAAKEEHGFVEGEGTIMLVDDEKVIIDTGREILENLGYQVVTAASGSEAIKIFEEKHSEIDLVILDYIMPEMGGGEVFEKMKTIEPGVKTILASGFSLRDDTRELLDRGCAGYIQKPFNPIRLSVKIHSVINGCSC